MIGRLEYGRSGPDLEVPPPIRLAHEILSATLTTVMGRFGPEHRDATAPLPAMAAVLIAVLALSIAGATDPTGGRSSRPLQLGTMFLRMDGTVHGVAFESEHEEYRAANPSMGTTRDSGRGGAHERIIGPAAASGPAQGDLPPPWIA